MNGNLKILLISILILIVFTVLSKKSDNFYNTKLNLAIDSEEESEETTKDRNINFLTFRNLSSLKETLNL